MNKSTLALAVAVGVLAQQAGAAGFIEDSKATLGHRSTSTSTQITVTVTVALPTRQAKTLNGARASTCVFISGYTQGTVQFGVDAIGLYGVRLDSSHPETRQLQVAPLPVAPSSSNGNKAVHDYASLGVTGKVKISQTELKLGTLQPKLPAIVTNDGRLLPANLPRWPDHD